jgi:prepilin-type N-terminal cleavage/methylation domain-containing protein
MKPLPHSNHCRRAFSLLEVMIAIAVFFVGAFSVLCLISSSLNNVRRLERPSVDASPVLATWSATNMLVEGHYHGSLADENLLGKEYRGYDWDLDINEVASNHLYQLDCAITITAGRPEVISRMSTVLYRPQSKPGSLDGGIGLPGR